MIGHLRGFVIHLDEKRLILSVNGVGYEIFPSTTLLSGGPSAGVNAAADNGRYGGVKVGEELAVHTYLNVKEDRLELFGFSTMSEKELFMELLTVSGVGPKLGLAIVSGLGEDKLKRAILAGDEASIKQISGVGSKSAKRVILELRSRLGDNAVENVASETGVVEEAMAALVSLGFSSAEASEAIFQSSAESLQAKSSRTQGSGTHGSASHGSASQDFDAPDLIKKALGILKNKK